MDPQLAPTIEYLAQQVKDLADSFRNHRHTGYDLTQKLYGTALSKVVLVDSVTLGDGKATSGTLTLKRASGKGSVYILGGTITAGDFANAGNNTGFILGEDDADTLDKLYFGSPGAYIKYDGAALTVIGTISSLNIKAYTDFEASGRFSTALGGTGTATFNTSGLQFASGATSGSYATVTWFLSQKMFSGSPVFTCVMEIDNTAGGTGEIFVGIGTPTNAGTGHTFTDNHIGFKIIHDGSTISLYATQADGTETASGALTTFANGDVVDLILKVNGTGSVDYWWRKNAGTLSAKTNLSTHVPTATVNKAQFSINNKSTTTQIQCIAISASLER